MIISGVKKEDVLDTNGNYHSVKGGSEMKGGDGIKGKWQVFLYKIMRFEVETSFHGREIFLKILKSYPQNYDDYINNKDIIKEKIKPYMIELKEYLSDYDNRLQFINKSFFNDRVKYFVVYHNDIFRVFDKVELINIFAYSLNVDVNSSYQKVVFKYNNKLVSEIEVRTTNDGKYPAILYNTLKHKICSIMMDYGLDRNIISPNIYVYGEAIKSFDLSSEVF